MPLGGGEVQIGGVLYGDSAEKAARFVMECNQTSLPIVFLQDVQGFMVGRQAEQSGIIRSGAKLVNVVSNSVVPKLTVIVGGSFGAGNYALVRQGLRSLADAGLALRPLCGDGGRAGRRHAAAAALRDAERQGPPLSEEEMQRLREEIRRRYEEQTDIRYGAARGWVDAIIAPHETRHWLATALGHDPRKIGAGASFARGCCKSDCSICRKRLRDVPGDRRRATVRYSVADARRASPTAAWSPTYVATRFASAMRRDSGATASTRPREMLALEPELDFLTLDFLAEVSMSILALQRSRDPEAGWPRDFVDDRPLDRPLLARAADAAG